MNVPTDDQIVASSKKRVRRNALKPNSVESDALREFSLLHTLDSKMALEGKGEEEQKGETYAESNDGEVASDAREKRQKISDSAQQIERPEPETIETMSVGALPANHEDDSSAQPTDAEVSNPENALEDADPPIVGDNDSETDESDPATVEREK